MSALVVALARDGAPLPPDLLDAPLRVLAPFGEQRARWVEGPLAMGHLARPTTPEAERERWPLHHPSGLVLVADARIDHRDELIGALALRGGPPPTDAELILAAHLRWGDEAPAHLEGDYAYALWQPAAQALLLVRSVMGMRGLFYRVTPRALHVATTAHGLIALGERPALRPASIASFVVGRYDRLWGDTFFEGIHKVPTGHSVRLTPRGGAEPPRPFWRLEPDERARWPMERQREALREGFDRAVAATLRSNGPLTIALSGGLDSSSVALTAHDLMHGQGGVSPQPASTYTLVMPDWPQTEESHYRRAAAARLPAFGQQLLEMPRAWTWPLAERWAALSSLPPALTNGYMRDLPAQFAHASGSRVLISGLGGDLLTGSSDYEMEASFRSLPWAERGAEAGRYLRALGGGRGLLRLAAAHGMPWALYQRWRRRHGAWLLPSIACELAAGPPAPASAQRGERPLQRWIREWLASPQGTFPFEYNGEIVAALGLEDRSPFADRRLIELAYQLPAQSRIHRGQTRYLFKQALHDRLPEALVSRTSKADFTAFVARAVDEADHERAVRLVQGGWLNERGWLDRRVLHRWLTGSPRDAQRATLHAVAHLEQWLASHQQPAPFEGASHYEKIVPG